MARAQKRKVRTVEKQKDSSKGNKDLWLKVGMLILVVLLVSGWGFASFWGMGQQEKAYENAEEKEKALQEAARSFGIGNFSGESEAIPEKETGYYAIYGQLSAPQDTATRLKGDLYLLDGGITQLIIVDSSPEKGNSNLGEYIVYSIKECGDFDCLVKDNTSTNAIFDLYELDLASNKLSANTIGIFREAIIPEEPVNGNNTNMSA